MYFYARGTARDYGHAHFWFRKAANAGLATAQRNLGDTYAYAMEPHDYKKAVFWLKNAAHQGDDIDQLTLANIYHYQKEVQDNAKSAYWMRKAANQGNADAQNALGNYYRTGSGVPQDHGKALFWYKRADGQGHVDAPYSIAQMYVRGNGVREDQSAAVQWFCRAAKQDNPNALYELQHAGASATECLIQLANQGNLLAQEELGRFYENAIGTVHDYVGAAFWSRKAAERGSASALNRLGDLYALGNGVPTDPVIAQMLYILAKPKTSGTQHSSRIRQPLLDSQINEARYLANGWKEGTPLPEKSETGGLSLEKGATQK
jgi:TPR repeat protein